MAARYATTVVLSAVAFAAIVLIGVFGLGTKEANAATARSCTGGSIQLKADEKRVLELHNRTRQNRGLRPLCVHPALQRAARAHSAQMIRKDRFFHGAVGSRLKRHGYRWKIYGENIAGGSGRFGWPQNVYKRWMNSRAHKKNILKKGFREVGIGTATGTYKGTRSYTMYTADFGSRR